ncbi:MAG TPA: pyridoxamine 5'-phosphate oxidase family protein [Paludibacteraceae bacterium]|jgi:hypothetical protein|nr:pyridoxamine 5'-phosphate oxidase family protein [Paludibacteraceae bacterium]HQB68950.1 pyridoxamine 5'-phosphate oxidase family protein [Paludibacteraceae bacterium]HRS67472.1 pyridoxamine 5'-phosphate oxidase family protein [Paludibacteraceae bacterium]
MKTTVITDTQEIENVIRSCSSCVVSFGGDAPYALPMNFAYAYPYIYMHSGPEDGHKLRLLAKNPKVCVVFTSPDQKLIYQHPNVGCSYSMNSKSVIAFGAVEFVEELDEKRQLMDVFMKQYTKNNVSYSDVAIANVKMWRIKIEQLTAKHFGQSKRQY